MILKGNIRAGGQELARHLMNDRDNDKTELAELRGFAGRDLSESFGEIEAIATGTNCTKPIYSLSINPSQQMSRAEYATAIDRIEAKLGLEGQPRAVVFHTKHGRDHCHVAWSRIDHERMQARHNAFDRQKLREVARELVRDFGHEMPKHLGQDRFSDRFNDRSDRLSLVEQGQSKRSGIAPADRREAITEAYRMADNPAAFRHALADRGYVLAQGDRRGQVVVDLAGDVHSLTRQIEGATAKEIRSKLDLSKANLPSVQDAKEQIAELARLRARVATQERPDTPDRTEIAQDALTALTDAQGAVLKAIRGQRDASLKAVREREAEQIIEAKAAIKATYRTEWAEVFRRQKAEIADTRKHFAKPMQRLKYILGNRDYDALDPVNKGHLSKAFNYVLRGQVDTAKLEKKHKAERLEIGAGMKQAERVELQAIKQATHTARTGITAQHRTATADVKSRYADRMAKAVKELEKARERDKEDRPTGRFDRLERDKPAFSGFGFAKQGFEQRGIGFGRGGREDDGDDERQIEPPNPDPKP